MVKLSLSDGAVSDYFGRAVAIDGDFMAIAAPFRSPSQGAVYLYARNQSGPENWGLAKTITVTDLITYAAFGSSVSLYGDTLVVGAAGTPIKGVAYVFGRNQGGTDDWGQVKKVTAPDGIVGDKFGNSVSLYQDTRGRRALYQYYGRKNLHL